MTTEELHPVVDLFLKRAASNPEEMAEGKWSWVVSDILEYGSEADKAAVRPVYKKLRLDDAHKTFMRELLNPEQPDLFTNQNQAIARAQNALTNNNPYKKLGQP
jgi:hypothetical protein